MTIANHRSREDVSRADRRNPSRGGAAVEFALVLPIFLLLVMGALDYGYFFFSNQVVAAAVREGARAGSMDSFGNAADTARKVAWNYMQKNGTNCSPPGMGCIITNASNLVLNGITLNKVTVDISYPFTSLTGYMSSIAIPGYVHGYAEMRW